MEPLSILSIDGVANWMTPIIQYLRNGTRPEDPVDTKRLAIEASYNTIINE